MGAPYFGEFKEAGATALSSSTERGFSAIAAAQERGGEH